MKTNNNHHRINMRAYALSYRRAYEFALLRSGYHQDVYRYWLVRAGMSLQLAINERDKSRLCLATNLRKARADKGLGQINAKARSVAVVALPPPPCIPTADFSTLPLFTGIPELPVFGQNASYPIPVPFSTGFQHGPFLPRVLHDDQSLLPTFP